ncbi:MAG: two-component system alkaline phosphatase synthesis response regulator PhoP [Lentimonas sp.]|jgi:two-component system alkaline phosphatase synthesis response regulator PhoP
MILNNTHTLLLVDDEPDILQFLSYNLKKEGFHVVTAQNGQEAIEIAKKIKPSLILLDVMMPKMDGIETCHQLRKDIELESSIVVFLTSRAEDYSQVAGFEAGADDYINKPIRPRLLVSKIHSLLRRADRARVVTQSEMHKENSLVINRERYMAELDGKDIPLPKKEFELLELLHSKPGKVFTRDQIMSHVWGNETIVGERTIDVHIRKLREKLGDMYIRTRKGVGYTFEHN